MCGIAGYYGVFDQREARSLLERMARSMQHRGPDGEGHWLDERIGFAHTRLAIIDAEGGMQPQHAVGARYVTVYNGEIYNHPELRAELEGAGYRFLTRSDTEVIPACLEHYGRVEGLLRLRGMFAFALWDKREQTLLLARDRFGMKPLYVARAGPLWLFASEPKTLFEWPELSRAADPVGLLDFFTIGQALAPRTAFSAVEELCPGTFVEFHGAGSRRGTWWTLPARRVVRRSKRDAARELENVLTRSVAAHLVSDVPVATFLSGGVDSSLLLALWRRSLAGAPVTFTAAYREHEYDESRHARRVAEHLGVENRELYVDGGDDAPALFERIVTHYDQPFGDSSCIPTWLLCREMARHGKVVLAGDCADEIFGGYGRYPLARILDRLNRRRYVRAGMQLAASLLGNAAAERARQLGKAASFAALSRRERSTAIHTLYDDRSLRGLFSDELYRAALREGSTASRLTAGVDLEQRDPALGMMELELRYLVPSDSLRKLDVAGSAHGLEVRTPYLDAEVLDFARSLAPEYLVGFGIRPEKPLLRRVARRYLPASTVNRKKQGFALNFDRWMGVRGRAFLQDLLSSREASYRTWMNASAFDTAMRECFGPRDARTLSRYQAYNRVFQLAAFELWLRRWRPSFSLGSP
jgi:asparagine synthase (glutamine-hydrolysing)